MFSQFLVLSSRGDTIINRDFRGDIVRGTAEIFFRRVKSFDGDCPPFFHIDGVTFVHVKKNNLFFVCLTKQNVSPFVALELLITLTKVFKDYCGVLTEESLRKNFVLIYELLDEMLDFGYIQSTRTEELKQFVFNEPISVVQPAEATTAKSQGKHHQKTIAPTASLRPISLSPRKTKGLKQSTTDNELFVDIFERLTVLFGTDGSVLRQEVDGSVQVKSFLKQHPELLIGLNENLTIIDSPENVPSYGILAFDDCTLNEGVDSRMFEKERVLKFVPPDGEFLAMNYRISSAEWRTPFSVFPVVEADDNKLTLTVKIRGDLPLTSSGRDVLVRIPVPKSVVSATASLPQGVMRQGAQYDPEKHCVEWKLANFLGGAEHSLFVKMSIASGANVKALRREIGPISMEFEIPMYVVSGIHIRFLRVFQGNKSILPSRWVRYLTHTHSYVSRVDASSE
eukprot:GCRY01005566.1.p1 GENE.GCRY01005566.1~~GCRY01005566.1.p1  ORF type:complete len:453 (+),score=111.96 GCRY01005566.1:196-1554(+)